MLQNKFAKGIKLKPLESKKQLKILEEIFVFSKGFKPYDFHEVNADVAQLSASKNICIKKLVYQYVALSSYCKEDIFLHVINSLANDLTDPNPLVRTTSLRSCTEISIADETSFEFVCKAVLQGLQDSAASVRCCAINGVIQLNLKTSLSSNKHNLTEVGDILKKVDHLINSDPDATVVVRSLECLAFSDALNENVHPIVLSLLHKMSMLDPHLILIVLHRANVSLNCVKLDSSEKFKLLNKLETLRSLSTYCSQTVQSFSLMLKLSSNLENVQNDVLVEIVQNMIAMFSVCNKNLRYFILSSLYAILRVYCVHIQEYFLAQLPLFLLWNDDDSHVLLKKLDILHFCINDNTAKIILANIQPYCFLSQMPHVLKATFSVMKTLYKYAPKYCEKIVYASLYSNFSVIVDSSVILFHYITIQKVKQDDDFHISSKFATALLACYAHLSLLEAKACFFMLISYVRDIDYAKNIANTVKAESNKFFDASSLTYQYSFMVALLRCFLRWPNVFHSNVKSLFSSVLKNNKHSFVYEQAKVYYRLLQKDDHSQLKMCVNFNKIPAITLPSIIQGSKIEIVLDELKAVAVSYD